MKVGDTLKLIATVLPKDATDKAVVWSSDNKEVATVDADGTVIAVGLGTATITATANDGSGVSAACTVHIIPTPVESLTLSTGTETLKVGDTLKLIATVLPKDATDKAVVWSSDNEEVATVDADGTVIAVGLGTAIITATATDDPGVSATCTVSVIPTLAESLTINPESWEGIEGVTFQIVAEVLPENTTNKALKWTSSDELIATVDEKGMVSVLKDGVCRVTVATVDGSNLTSECIITGYSSIDGIFTDADERFDVYNLHGSVIILDGQRDDLKKLSAGMYILRQGSKARKIFIH